MISSIFKGLKSKAYGQSYTFLMPAKKIVETILKKTYNKVNSSKRIHKMKTMFKSYMIGLWCRGVIRKFKNFMMVWVISDS